MAYYELNPQSVYPNQLDTFIDKKDAKAILPTTPDTGEWVMAGHVNFVQNSIKAMQSALGINPQAEYPSLASRLDATLGGYNSLRRIECFYGNPRMAGIVAGNAWNDVSFAYQYFKTIDLCFYNGTYETYGSDIASIKNNCNTEFSIYLEHQDSNNNIDLNILSQWTSVGIKRFWIDLSQVSINLELNGLITNLRKIKDVTFDFIFYSDNSDFITKLEDIIAPLALIESDGLFCIKKSPSKEVIKNILNLLYQKKQIFNLKTGMLFLNTDAQSLYQQYFFGVGLSFIYNLNYFGLNSAVGTTITQDKFLLYPYIPLNIDYLNSTNMIVESDENVSKIVDSYNIKVNIENSTLSSDLLKIPSSFIYFDEVESNIVEQDPIFSAWLADKATIFIDTEFPEQAKVGDILVDTDDYSRYDILSVSTEGTGTVLQAEIVEFTGTSSFTYTLSTLSITPGCIKKLKNSSSAIIIISATIDGGSLILYPLESVELVWNGTDWRIL